jgi:RNA polymerase sigma-70 factor (ECF subfamily)
VRSNGPRTTEQEARRDEDAALAAALLGGEPGAPDRAWTQLSPLVLRILRRYFASGSDHQDLCQEVFLRFFSRIAELRDRRALRHFLVGICLGVAQNERRRAYVRRTIDLSPTGDLPDYPVAPSDLESRQAMRRLCEVLAGAGSEECGLFAVRHVDKMELADIAASNGWSLAKTKRRVARLTRRVGLRLRREPALAEYAGAFRV